MVPKSAWEVSANLRARSKREKSFTPEGNLLIQERLYTQKASAALQNSLASVEDRQEAGLGGRRQQQPAAGGRRRRAGGRKRLLLAGGESPQPYYILPPAPPICP